MSSSSPPTSPSPVDSDKDKVPIPVESTISGEKLAELPRPEPQHPSPNRGPVVSSPSGPVVSPHPHLPASSSSHIPQGFVPLPPLPAFVFRPHLQPQIRDSRDSSTYPPTGPPPVSNRAEGRTPPPQLSDHHSNSNTPFNSVCGSSSDSRDSRSGASPAPRLESVPSISRQESSSDSRETSVIATRKIKEEVVTPPPSPGLISVKQEPVDTFMSSGGVSVGGQNVGSGANKSGMDGYNNNPKNMCATNLVTPKLEPGISPGSYRENSRQTLSQPQTSDYQSSASSANTNASQSQNLNASVDMTMSLTPSVKGHLNHVSDPHQGQSSAGDLGEGERSGSGVEMDEDSDSDREGTLTPGPVPTPCNKEILRSKSAM